MHPNLANISRAWVTETIVTRESFLNSFKSFLTLKVGAMRIGPKPHPHRMYQLYMLIQKSEGKLVRKIIEKTILETNGSEPVIFFREIKCSKKIGQQPYLLTLPCNTS